MSVLAFLRALRAVLAPALWLLAGPAAAQQVHQQSEGDCSPNVNYNSGSITIHCGVGNEELLKALHELLASNSQALVLTTLQQMNQELAKLRKEDSDPRRQLAKLGVSWADESFGNALLQGDVRLVKLFLSGKKNLYGDFRGLPTVAHFVAQGGRLEGFETLFKLLLTHGLDVDRELPPTLSAYTTLAEHAVAGGNDKALRLIWQVSRKREFIRDVVRKHVGAAQDEQRLAHAGSPPPIWDAASLVRMLQAVEPELGFTLKGHTVRFETGASGRASRKARLYDGPDGWFLLLETTSLLRSVTYEVGGRRQTVQRTSRLPIELGQPLTSVRLEAVDATGRPLGPLTIEVDSEDLK